MAIPVQCQCGQRFKAKSELAGKRVKCPKCGEGYFNSHDAYVLSEYRKVKDEVLEGKVTKSGNSYVIRLPIELVRALGLKKGNTVQLKVQTPNEVILITG